jgi:hypothetical protein
VIDSNRRTVHAKNAAAAEIEPTVIARATPARQSAPGLKPPVTLTHTATYRVEARGHAESQTGKAAARVSHQ